MKSTAIRTMMIAAGLVIATSGASFAAPIAPGPTTLPTVEHHDLIQVRDGRLDRSKARRHHHGRRHHHHSRHHHWRGPPRGWHRYQHRPWDWERRGCLLFGPVWFCP